MVHNRPKPVLVIRYSPAVANFSVPVAEYAASPGLTGWLNYSAYTCFSQRRTPLSPSYSSWQARVTVQALLLDHLHESPLEYLIAIPYFLFYSFHLEE